jgi:CRP/FNR family transcriptional regulator, cyclic AMP receptor protein
MRDVGNTRSAVTSPETVQLLEIEPELARFMTEADRTTVGEIGAPVVTVTAGELDLTELLSAHRSFAAIVLDGMLVRRIVVGESATLRLLGPGDLVGMPTSQASMLIAGSGMRVAAPTRLALLGRDVLLAAHRAPRLVAGLQARSTEQSDRVALQLAICQLPRVEDRVLSMLWLLAESWGHVTAQGTALRLRLTHETIGGLVGARRSTVTLALGQLADDGAIARHEEGWMLLKPPPVFDAPRSRNVPPEILTPLEAQPPPPPPLDRAEVLARVRELREVGEELMRVRQLNTDRAARDVARARETREHSATLRRLARARRAAEPLGSRLHHHDGAGDALGGAERHDDDAAPEGLAPPVDGLDH